MVDLKMLKSLLRCVRPGRFLCSLLEHSPPPAEVAHQTMLRSWVKHVRPRHLHSSLLKLSPAEMTMQNKDAPLPTDLRAAERVNPQGGVSSLSEDLLSEDVSDAMEPPAFQKRKVYFLNTRNPDEVCKHCRREDWLSHTLFVLATPTQAFVLS